jgi:hypothetical protein
VGAFGAQIDRLTPHPQEEKEAKEQAKKTAQLSYAMERLRNNPSPNDPDLITSTSDEIINHVKKRGLWDQPIVDDWHERSSKPSGDSELARLSSEQRERAFMLMAEAVEARTGFAAPLDEYQHRKSEEKLLTWIDSGEGNLHSGNYRLVAAPLGFSQPIAGKTQDRRDLGLDEFNTKEKLQIENQKKNLGDSWVAGSTPENSFGIPTSDLRTIRAKSLDAEQENFTQFLKKDMNLTKSLFPGQLDKNGIETPRTHASITQDYFNLSEDQRESIRQLTIEEKYRSGLDNQEESQRKDISQLYMQKVAEIMQTGSRQSWTVGESLPESLDEDMQPILRKLPSVDWKYESSSETLEGDRRKTRSYAEGFSPAFAQEKRAVLSSPSYAGHRDAVPMRSSVYKNAVINSSEIEVPASQVYSRMFGPAGANMKPKNPSETHAILNPAQQQSLGFSAGFIPNFSTEQFTAAITEAMKNGIASFAGGMVPNVSNSNTVNINDERSYQGNSDSMMDGVLDILQSKFPKEMGKMGPRIAKR